MSYVTASLTPGETVRATAHMHWILWLRAWAELIFLGIIIIGIVLFIRDVALLTTTEVAITNRRLIMKTGVVERHTAELELSSVETVNLDQSFWGRLLDFGRVRVHGTGEDVWVSPLISAPVRFRSELEAALSGVTANTSAVWPRPAKA